MKLKNNSKTWRGVWPLFWELQINGDRQSVREWAEIEQALDPMDNEAYAYIGLGFDNDDEHAIEVYGGHEDRVHLVYTDQSSVEVDFALVDMTQTQPVALFDSLHQWYFRDLDPHHCVNKSLARRALKHFFDTQSRDESLDWTDL